MFVATKLLSLQICVATNTHLSRQTHIFVATKDVLGRHVFVVLSRQNYVCRDKYLSWQKVCLDNNILARQTYFCRNKHTFVATKHVFYRDDFFVATKMILVAEMTLLLTSLTPHRLAKPAHKVAQPDFSPSTEAHRKLFGSAIFDRWSLGPERSQSGWPGFSNVRVARRRLIVN